MIDWILMASYWGLMITILVYKRKDIWKGICGGNGIPQTNELVKMTSTIAIVYEFSGILFLHYPADYGLLGTCAAIVGITGINFNKNGIFKQEQSKPPNVRH